MILKKVSTAVCIVASFCAAQSINIRGTIQDNAGVGIAEATVKLEVANISTVSGSDGSFTLTGNPTEIIGKENMFSKAVNPIRFQKDRLELSLSENTLFTISVYDVRGRQIFRNATIFNAGSHIISSYPNTVGLNLYKITIGQNVYTVKSLPFGTFAGKARPLRSGCDGRSFSKRAKAKVVISDVIFITKEGRISSRDSINTYDTSGIVVKMVPNVQNVTDADGNVYQSVRIGNQVWTVVNLKTTKYNDSTPIPNVTDATVWSNCTTGAYSYYDNNDSNKSKYGALYNWYAVATGKLAPKGWHVPTDAEWDTLQNYLIGNGYNWDGTTSGDKIAKAMAAKTDWYPSDDVGNLGNNPGSNNNTWFSALPGGYRFDDGFFRNQSLSGFWWSATESLASRAFGRNLYYGNEGLGRDGNVKPNGFSILHRMSNSAKKMSVRFVSIIRQE